MYPVACLLGFTSLLLHFGFFGLSEPSPGRAYFVSVQGDDAGLGSRTEPWRSVARANRAELKPGDRLFFNGGDVFEGTLTVKGRGAAGPDQRIIIGSYGLGVATIDGGDHRAVSIEDCRNIRVENLRLVGSGRKSGNTESGLYVSGVTDIEVDSIEVSGFRYSGVFFTGVNNGRFTRIHAYENGFSGISSLGDLSTDIYVGHCLTENNPGDPSILDNHSGNGIVLGRVQNGIIEYCESRYNGWDMPREGNGPVGIWSYHSDNLVIQYNIAHHNRSTGIDGGGFDFDGGMTNSFLQYNYSHNNHGSGYLICQYKGAAPFFNNVVRYNISQDDGLTNHDAGIFLWQGDVGMETTDVYNNTVFNSKGSGVAFGAATGVEENVPLGRFYNNIFVTGESQIAGGAHKGEFKGNLYWAMGDGGFRVDDHTSLEEWAEATGQEMLDGRLVGLYADPLLTKNGTGLITDPLKLLDLTDYLLRTGSPAVDQGLNLRELLGFDPGSTDFYGNTIPQGTGYDIGAHEMVN